MARPRYSTSSKREREDDINMLGNYAKKARVARTRANGIEFREVASSTRDDEELPYRTYDRHNYQTGSKDKGIVEDVSRFENRMIDTEVVDKFLPKTVATINSLHLSICAWKHETVLWAIRKHLLEEHVGSSLDAALATQDDDGRYIGRIWACHTEAGSNEKKKKAVTNKVMRIWEKYKMKFILQNEYCQLREIETQYTLYRNLVEYRFLQRFDDIQIDENDESDALYSISSSESSSTDEDDELFSFLSL